MFSNSIKDIRSRKEKMKGSNQGEMNHETLWTSGNKLRVAEGRRVREWVNLVMGIKEGWTA